MLPSPSAGELPSLQSLREAEAMWLKARSLDSPTALADHLEAHVLDLSEAVARVVAEATEELSRREDVWRPLGQALALWLPHAEQFAATKDHVDQLKEAEDWWKSATEEIRNERFQPIAARAMAIWKQLRLQSNVDLGDVTLEGTATRRKVVLKVTVDGKDAEALGVMSQGELHSLALSLFLPRATLPDSPFRFICVDDPVQSMDPARVEALARVLADTAKTRQVVVFTHDDRLPEAVRRLGLPARILKVTRRADSVVEIGESRDPVSGYLDDARALLKTDELPASVRARVVPGHCRLALEAACMTAVRQRRLRAGARHQEVEELLAAHPKLYARMALAIFDDAEKASEVLPRLNKLDPRAAAAFKALQRRRARGLRRRRAGPGARHRRSWPTRCCGWARNDAAASIARGLFDDDGGATGTHLRARCWPPSISSWTCLRGHGRTLATRCRTAHASGAGDGAPLLLDQAGARRGGVRLPRAVPVPGPVSGRRAAGAARARRVERAERRLPSPRLRPGADAGGAAGVARDGAAGGGAHRARVAGLEGASAIAGLPGDSAPRESARQSLGRLRARAPGPSPLRRLPLPRWRRRRSRTAGRRCRPPSFRF